MRRWTQVVAEAGLAESHALAFVTEGAWEGAAVACAVRRARGRSWGRVRQKEFPDAMRLVERGRVDGGDPLGPAGGEPGGGGRGRP